MTKLTSRIDSSSPAVGVERLGSGGREEAHVDQRVEAAADVAVVDEDGDDAGVVQAGERSHCGDGEEASAGRGYNEIEVTKDVSAISEQNPLANLETSFLACQHGLLIDGPWVNARSGRELPRRQPC